LRTLADSFALLTLPHTRSLWCATYYWGDVRHRGHASFRLPNNDISSPNFGGILEALPGRLVQLALKFAFRAPRSDNQSKHVLYQGLFSEMLV
jgi:hypothetical protein